MFNPNDYSCNRRINGLIRFKEIKKNLYGEFEMRNGLLREHQAKYCQEIEELRRICCEETDRARHPRIYELTLLQERNPMTANHLLTQTQHLQNKVNFLSDAREFYDPETASSFGATHVPSQPSTIPSPRTMPCRDSGLPHDTRNIVGTSGNVFERLPAREGQTSTLFIRSHFGSRCFCSNVCCLLCGLATSEQTPTVDLRCRPRQS